MSDERITSLIPIEDGSEAEAKPLRQNFTYLDERINTMSSGVSNKETLSAKNQPNGYCGLDANGNVAQTVLSKVIASVLGSLFPVGGLYVVGFDSTTCPIAPLIPGSTWEKVGFGEVLQVADQYHAVGTHTPAALPNLWGNINFHSGDFVHEANGVFSVSASGTSVGLMNNPQNNNLWFDFNAKRNNSIYQDGATVQPPAYRVMVWRRTA